MKLTALALILLLTSSIHVVNSQEKSKQLDDATKLKIQKLRELEAQLEFIPPSAKVETKGNEESPTITIEWEETLVETASTKAKESQTQTKRLNINLNELDVPDEYIDEKIQAAFQKGKCGKLEGVVLSQVGVSRDYEVVKDYKYDADGHIITVFKGFVYDRASIPRGLWIFLDKDSLGNVAPLIHDLLYRHGGVLPQNQISPYRKFSRKDADKIFRDVLGKCGVPSWQREAAYLAVRSPAGLRAWKGKRN